MHVEKCKVRKRHGAAWETVLKGWHQRIGSLGCSLESAFRFDLSDRQERSPFLPGFIWSWEVTHLKCRNQHICLTIRSQAKCLRTDTILLPAKVLALTKSWAVSFCVICHFQTQGQLCTAANHTEKLWTQVPTFQEKVLPVITAKWCVLTYSNCQEEGRKPGFRSISSYCPNQNRYIIPL